MHFFVGTYSVPGSPGIALCMLMGCSMQLVDSCDVLQNPTWLTWSADTECLYAIGRDRQEEQVIASFKVVGGRLRVHSTTSTGGNSSCHLTISPDGRHIIAAHYHEGRVSLYPLHDGKVGTQLQVVQQQGQGPHAERQKGPHAHQSVFRPGTQQVFVCDLGADAIFEYELDNQLVLADKINAPPGTGPRHLVFDGQNRMYVCAEISSEVLYYALDENSRWALRQRLSALPEPMAENTSAAIRLWAGHLAVSNRGHDSIALFEMNEHGMLRAHRHLPAHGQGPRDFVRFQDKFLMPISMAAGYSAWHRMVRPSPACTSPARFVLRAWKNAASRYRIYLFKSACLAALTCSRT